MFNRYLFLTIIFLLFSNIGLVKAQEKIAFIDLNYIFDNSNAGKKFLKDIDNKKKKINNEFEKYKKEIKNDRDNLIKQQNVIAKEEFEKKAIELEKNTKKYNLTIRNKNKDLTQYQLKGRTEFYNILRPILETYSTENSISLILKKENILIGKTDLDISKNILELFNKKIKTIKIK